MQNICSRREAERWLSAGRIRVNGEIVDVMGTTIDPDLDRVTIDGPKEGLATTYHYIAFNKPFGIVSNLPVGNEQEIRDFLPPSLSGLSTIGRLDKDSEGLILLTDDGVFAKLALGQTHEREYEVIVDGEFNQGMARRLEEGMIILGEYTLPVRIKHLGPDHFLMKMREGKNRQIRRMVAKVGLNVLKLVRRRYGTIVLDDIPPGKFRHLTPGEIVSIRESQF